MKLAHSLDFRIDMITENKKEGVAGPGVLYIVATPIGNLEDITYRAVKILQEVDVVAAEDTRHSRVLLQHFGINTPLIALHEHNEQQRAAHLLDRIEKGEKIALISDAGTPLISDPGYRIVSEAHSRELTVTPIPGASAVTAAISVSGQATDRFVFEGFLVSKQAARRRQLMTLENETRTIIFYESGRRMLESLQDMQDCFGTERYVTVAKEMTKRFETIKRLQFSQAIVWFSEVPERLKGEFVVIVSGCNKNDNVGASLQQAEKAITLLSPCLSAKQTVSIVTQLCDIPKNQAYKMFVEHNKNNNANTD
ncbi:16S rRNA (cytidine(1402)-2'-O)-methyltransferase [hydrothermal vent metagenome]|uniref:16S rRNA (Cytidine(1402)-2'-O)-methyltransferase n=1 Tax=hydrothermal vent metagenome TaxID=652676 RepID=A0A3B0XXW0_9ZZZZ